MDWLSTCFHWTLRRLTVSLCTNHEMSKRPFSESFISSFLFNDGNDDDFLGVCLSLCLNLLRFDALLQLCISKKKRKKKKLRHWVFNRRCSNSICQKFPKTIKQTTTKSFKPLGAADGRIIKRWIIKQALKKKTFPVRHLPPQWLKQRASIICISVASRSLYLIMNLAVICCFSHSWANGR